MSCLPSRSRRAEKYKKLETSGHSRSCGKSAAPAVLPRKYPALCSNSQSSVTFRLTTQEKHNANKNTTLYNQSILFAIYGFCHLDAL